MDDLAPIVLFAYNRLWHTQQTVEALKRNDLASESELYIYSDGAKGEKDKTNVLAVREYIKSITGFKSIHITEREKNYGLADSVIKGVTEVIEKHGKVIVLEDDIVTSPKFLLFMNEALSFYKDNKRIFSISGYSYPVSTKIKQKEYIYFSRRSSSWGWATWKDRWNKALWEGDVYDDFLNNKVLQKKLNVAGRDLTPMLKKHLKGKINSWAVRWAFTHLYFDGLCVLPFKSLTKNIGTDGTGTNFKIKTKKFNTKLDLTSEKPMFSNRIIINENIEKSIREIVKPGFITQVINFFRL